VRPGSEALAIVAIALAACVPYAASVGYGFTFDDANTILGHPGVRGPFSAEDLLLRDNWGRPWFKTIGNWRPVATLDYWVDWHLGSGRPWVFHAHNLLLYALVLILYAVFSKRFFGQAMTPASRLLALAVVGALTLHGDVVPSATGRSEIAAALFAFLALLAPLREAGPVRAREVLLTAGASILAACSKESGLPVALLAPVLAYRWHRARGTNRRNGMIALSASCTAALCGVVAFRALRMPWWGMGPKLAMEDAVLPASTAGRLVGAAEVLVAYLGHFFYPVRLAPDYSYAGIVPGHAPLPATLGLALVAAGIGTLVRAWPRPPGIADALLGFVAAYVLASHAIVPSATAMADRLFFFPSFWVVTVGALVLGNLEGRRKGVAAGLAAAFALGQAAVATTTASRWRDDVTLLTSAVKARPNVARLRRGLAQALADRGVAEDAAWQLAVTNAIMGLYPAALPANDFPARWDGEPTAARLAALRDRIGQSGLRDALGNAAAVARRWGYEDVAAILDGWLLDL
jgi:hypothetical protein